MLTTREQKKSLNLEKLHISESKFIEFLDHFFTFVKKILAIIFYSTAGSLRWVAEIFKQIF